MTIPADPKDWTWVLRRPCPECGFDAAGVTPADLPERFVVNAAGWRHALEAVGTSALRRRPADGVWSPVEYACHVRDVYRLFAERLSTMLTEHDPVFASWNQNAAAVENAYQEADPLVVAGEIEAAAAALADLYRTVDGDTWERTGRRADGARFTVESLGRYGLHDVHHHLHDVSGA